MAKIPLVPRFAYKSLFCIQPLTNGGLREPRYCERSYVVYPDLPRQKEKSSNCHLLVSLFWEEFLELNWAEDRQGQEKNTHSNFKSWQSALGNFCALMSSTHFRRFCVCCLSCSRSLWILVTVVLLKLTLLLWGLLSWWPWVECMPLQVGWNHSLSYWLFCFIFCLLSTERRWMLSLGLSPAKLWREGPKINMVIFLSVLLIPVEVNIFQIPLEHSVVKGKGSSHLFFCTLTAHAYFFCKITIQTWLLHLKVARSEEHCAISHVTPVFALTLHFQNSSNPSLWQWEQSITQCYFCCSSIYLTFFFSSYYFPLNLCDASDQSWLPFSSSAWHPGSEWP